MPRRKSFRRRGIWKFTAARAKSIRKAQAIRAIRQKRTPNKVLKTKNVGSASNYSHIKSSDTLGKYARSGMKTVANKLTFNTAGMLSGVLEDNPGGKKKWYAKM